MKIFLQHPPSFATLMPQYPKARHVFYCSQGSAGASVLHHTLQTRPAATKDVPHQDLQPKGAYWRVTAHCHGLLRVFCTTTHSVPGVPWQHQSSGHRSLALLTLFQMSFDRFAEVQSLSQMALGWVWLLINVCHLGDAFAGSEYGNSVAPVCSREDNPERSSKPLRR